MRGAEEIVPDAERRSAITSQTLGVQELGRLLIRVPAGEQADAYRAAVVDDNALGLATKAGRQWRFATLRRLYFLRPDSVLFRALRELLADDPNSLPLLAGLCAMATDVVFRATADLVIASRPGDRLSSGDFAEALQASFPGVYAPTTLRTVAAKAYASWAQTGHLAEASGGRRVRRQAACRPANVAYALMLGHLTGARGEALFDTTWARVLDQPRSQLYNLASAAAGRGMLEYRNSGGVVDVGFRELLRPMDGELL